MGRIGLRLGLGLERARFARAMVDIAAVLWIPAFAGMTPFFNVFMRML